MTLSSFRAQIVESRYIPFFFLSTGMVLALFLWEGHKGFDLWDEGFLWYGVQRVLLGDVPIRDFMAYDPGRYYWSASLMHLWGGDNGILALRAAAAVFQALGLFIGLVALSRNQSKQSFLFWILSAITILVWMSPLYKLFDIVVSIVLLSGLAFLIEQPSIRRYFAFGVLVGLMAVFGRNHGFYGFVSGLGCLGYLSIGARSRWSFVRPFAMFLAGIAIGYSPILIMSVAIPGFAYALWESVRFLFEVQATNLQLPIPWPWVVDYKKLGIFEVFQGWLLGIFFIAIFIFGVVVVAWGISKRLKNEFVSPLLVSSAFLSLVYTHYAYSRADTLHLSMGVVPFVMGCLVFAINQQSAIKWPIALLVATASLMVMAPLHPGWVCYASQKCIEADVGGSNLMTHPNVPIELDFIEDLVSKYARNNSQFLVTPYWPGAYSVMNRKSPVWEIYALFPRGESFQLKEIERLKTANLGFALIIDVALDSREELRFKNTHPLIDNYIQENYQRLDGVTPDPVYQLYVKRVVSH